MNCRRHVASAVILSLATLAPLPAAENHPVDDRAVENLATFARVYGYVRFFHPSDEAAAVDWDKVSLLGAETVHGATNSSELRLALLRVFQPIAPSMQLVDSAQAAAAAETSKSAGTGNRLTFWQYGGINLTDKPGAGNPYRQQRVITGEEHGERAPLFRPATVPPLLTKLIAPGLVLMLPLALPVDANDKTSATSPEFGALQARLANLDLKTLAPADWRLRVAGVVTVWSIFQHFHPYLDTIGVKWDDALKPALWRALRDETGADYWATLTELVAVTRDGHGYVYGPRGNLGGIPIRVAEAEGKLVVSAVGGDAPFRKGDIIDRKSVV